ncbi:MAG TPA: TonB-dependent receptor [Terriglobales bacterium]|nr:TonB-dependent receptor [Terriglobales bacterium]
MPRFRSVSLLLLSAAIFATVFASAPFAHSQTATTTAALSGSVSDPTGARVANATVTLSSPEKGVIRTFKTDAQGNFSFALLPAATYMLSVEASGFKTIRQQGITLEVGQSATQDITLTIGTSEQIEVTTQAPLLQTDNANVGDEISTKQITELPLSLRNVFTFVQLNSSVNNRSQQQLIQGGGEQSTADQDVSFFNFGGGYFGTTAFLLDGAWDTSTGWGGVMYVPSPDNVQEFKVQQNSFSAQYGWSTGNVVNVVTKSGTSGLHGSAYEYLRNGDLDANFYFNNHATPKLPRPNSHRNQFGVALGGPVFLPHVYERRDKTFWFFNYEGHRENDPLATEGTVPTANYRTGDFSAQLGANSGTDACGRPILAGQLYDPFSTRTVASACGGSATAFIRDPIPGNNLATYHSPYVAGGAGNLINAIGSKLLNFYPATINGGLQNNWGGTGAAGNNSDEVSGRIDHNFSDATRLYGRYSYKREFKGESPDYFGASDPAGPGQVNPNNRWDAGIGLSQVFSPTFTMSVNVGGMKWIEGNNMQSAGFQPSTLGFPAFIDPNSAQFPTIVVPQGFIAEGPLQGAGEARFPRSAVSDSVDLVKMRGNHQFSFGYMQVAIEENGGRIAPTQFNFDNAFTAGPDPTSPTANTGNVFASMLVGTPTSGSTGVAVFNVSRTWLYGTYLQDDWKATRKLTLNLGLRWEVQTPMTDYQNRLTTFNYNVINPITTAVNDGTNYTGAVQFASSGNRGQYNANYKHFAPRIGFAYQLMPKLVMRGGYGIFYPNQFLNSPNIQGYNSTTPFVSSLDGGLTPCAGCTLSNAFPSGPVPIVGNSQGALTNVGFSDNAVNPNRKTFYDQQWMYGVQYAPTGNDVIDITYVGNHTVHTIDGGLNLNQLDPKYFSMGSALTAQVANPFFGHIASSGCGLANPTVAAGQLLRPHPEFCNINELDDPAGASHYNALDVNYTHRVSQGLTLLASYTFSKFIDNVAGPETWATSSGESIRNVYNLAAEKSVDLSDTPNSVVLSYVYEIPVGKGKKFAPGMSGVVNQILGGWQMSGIFTFKQGFPLSISEPNSNPFGVGQHANVVGDYHVAHPSITEWFNTAAFAQAPQFDLGNAPRYFSDLRAPHYNNWDIGIQKNFQIVERSRLEFRMDMFNAFNHTNFYSPNTALGPAPPLGNFGTINQTWAPRIMQAALRLYW